MTCFAPALTANLGAKCQSIIDWQERGDGHKHAENSRAASYVQDYLVFEEVFILIDRVLV